MFTVRRFAELKDRIPADAWFARRPEFARGEFDDELVLHASGPVTLAQLDLAAPVLPGVADGDAAARALLILVEGALRIDGTLLSPADDTGTAGLMVLGPLTLRNALLGGQQVYVAGDLVVHELLWGHYNHGDLTVHGAATVGLLMQTEQYHLNLHGARHITRWLSDEGRGQWDLSDSFTLRQLFAPLDEDGIWTDQDGMPQLSMASVRSSLEQGQPVIDLEDLPYAPYTEVPPLPQDGGLNLATVLEVTSPRRMDAVDGPEASYEFEADGLFTYVAAHAAHEGEPPARLIKWVGDTHLFVLTLEADPATPGQWTPGYLGRALDEDGQPTGDTLELSFPLPPEYAPLIDLGWPQLLSAVAACDHLTQAITPAMLRALLALPVVEPYDHYYSDGCGFWAGPAYFAFRQEGTLYEGTPMSALLRVTREEPADDADTDEDGNEPGDEDEVSTHWFFWIEKRVDGSEYVAVSAKAQSDDDEADNEDVPIAFQDDPLLGLALQTFRVATALLHAANQRLLDDGEVPDDDDHFAIAHWRAQGLLAAD